MSDIRFISTPSGNITTPPTNYSALFTDAGSWYSKKDDGSIVNIGSTGPVGSSGYSGYSGAGFSGYSGYSGLSTSGYSGYSSHSGYSGYSGAAFVGSSGYSGYSGSSTSGYSGYSGNDGLSTSGYSGYSGPQGIQGFSGYSGGGGGGAGTITGPAITVPSGIATWANTTGTALWNSPIGIIGSDLVTHIVPNSGTAASISLSTDGSSSNTTTYASLNYGSNSVNVGNAGDNAAVYITAQAGSNDIYEYAAGNYNVQSNTYLRVLNGYGPMHEYFTDHIGSNKDMWPTNSGTDNIGTMAKPYLTVTTSGVTILDNTGVYWKIIVAPGTGILTAVLA